MQESENNTQAASGLEVQWEHDDIRVFTTQTSEHSLFTPFQYEESKHMLQERLKMPGDFGLTNVRADASRTA